MIVNRNLVWTAVKVELPTNTRPVTAVVSSLDGAHTIGAYYKDNKWFEQLTKKEVEIISNIKVLCWADFELPESHFI
jgi:hypothetical protein